MLTLLLTVLATAYFVVPDLLYRLVFGFFLVRKTMNSPKGEELMRGAFWSILPLLVAWSTRRLLCFRFPAEVAPATQIVGSSLFSDKIFQANPDAFYVALPVFVQANVALLARMYLIVFLGSAILGILARNFGSLRLKVKGSPWLSKILHATVLPRISEWHFALSSMLLADPQQYCVSVDVRLKGGALYRGSVSEKKIGSDGTLQTLVLSSVERFLHLDFARDLSAYESSEEKLPGEKPVSDSYWRRIPGELFVIVGSDISTVNVRHVSTLASTKPNEDVILKELLVSLNDRLKRLGGPSPERENESGSV